MKTVAFVPIKLNNERTPGKNIKSFYDGTPLVSFVQESLLGVKGIDEIYCYCSNSQIKDYLLDGVKYLERSDKLDTKETRCNDIIKAFIQDVEADVYIMAHATSPFVTTEHIQECLDAVHSGKFDSAYAAVKMQNFIWYKDKPLNFDISNNLRTQDMEPVYCELSTPFVFTKKAYEVHGGRTGDNPYRCECSTIEGIDIDYPEDFELANVVYKEILRGKKDVH